MKLLIGEPWARLQWPGVAELEPTPVPEVDVSHGYLSVYGSIFDESGSIVGDGKPKPAQGKIEKQKLKIKGHIINADGEQTANSPEVKTGDMNHWMLSFKLTNQNPGNHTIFISIVAADDDTIHYDTQNVQVVFKASGQSKPAPKDVALKKTGRSVRVVITPP